MYIEGKTPAKILDSAAYSYGMLYQQTQSLEQVTDKLLIIIYRL